MGQGCCLVVLIWADIWNKRGWSKTTLSPYTQSTEVAGALTKINLSYFNYDSLSSLSLSSLLLSHIHCLDRELQVFFHLGLIKKEKSISFSAITVFSIWSFETVRGSEIEFPERKSCLMDPSTRFLEGEISAFSLACRCVWERASVNTDGRLEVIMTNFDCPGFYWRFLYQIRWLVIITTLIQSPHPQSS